MHIRRPKGQAKNCLAHAGEILAGNQLGSNAQQLAAALEGVLSKKDRVARGEH